MKNLKNLGKTLSRAEQKMIIGSGGLICCEWCSDGSCESWTEIGVTCPFTEAC